MRRTTISWFLAFWLGGFGLRAFSSDTLRDKKLRAYPFAFFTKETSLAVGGAALYFLPHSDSTHCSYLQFTAVRSLRKQTNIEFWYQVFLNRSRYKLTGFTDYNRFPLLYFGTGEMPGTPESFTPDQLRFRSSLLRNLTAHCWLGPRYWFESNTIFMSTPEGMLNMHPQLQRVSAPGLAFQRDTRNNSFYPENGSFVEISLLKNAQLFGGTSQYTHLIVDVRQYHALSKRLILASQFYLNNISGSPSVLQLAMAGGPRLLRGYYQGMFRDKHFSAIQEEFRFTITKRFKAVAFASLGSVRKQIDVAPTTLLFSGGTGMRVALDLKKQIHLRTDVAITRNGEMGFYILMEEAF